MMRRRTFIAGVGSAAAWTVGARGQQPTMPVIGFLNPAPPNAGPANLAGFHRGLGETGFVEGRNLAIEYRFADDDNTRLPELAAELVRRQVSVLAVPGSTVAALAAKAATATIPIVFGIGADPIQVGLVTNLNRPGGNVTGVTEMSGEVGPKRYGLIRELLPQARRFGVLVRAFSV
jgi:putative ABC transport system substrate-binding protein